MGPFFVTRDVPADAPDEKTVPADIKNSRHAIPIKMVEFRPYNSTSPLFILFIFIKNVKDANCATLHLIFVEDLRHFI